MTANQGLKGRFAHHLHFEDYTADELMQICCKLFDENQYILTSEAETLLKSVIERMVKSKDRYFCNARWAKQLVESGILPAMAQRVMQKTQSPIDATNLTVTEGDDIEAAALLYSPIQPQVRLRPRIGFVA
jgi:hypothetical protein